jgi:hypothetical protein
VDNAQVKELIRRYQEGITGPDEIAQLEYLLETGTIGLEAFHELGTIENQVHNLETGLPSQSLDDAFYTMLRDEIKKEQSLFERINVPRYQLLFRIAAAVLLVMSGIAIGHFLDRPQASDGQVHQLSEQVSELKEMMMLALLDKEEATERLKAVNLTQGMNEVSTKVTQALFRTLNNDENVNVRLAALEALTPYTGDERIREELVRSIGKQDSPLVQLALAELMAALQEKSSLDALQKILNNDRTPEAVKRKIEESILVMS